MEKIIVVEDSNLLRMRIVKVLEDYGYENVIAFNNADVIGSSPQLFFNHVRLVLTDLQLPGMSGIELSRIIQREEKYANIPIIFVSSYRDKKIINEALESGAVDYIVKPFEDHFLLERVRKIIGEPKKEREKNAAHSLEQIKQIIVIEYERAMRGKQNLSFVKAVVAGDFKEKAAHEIRAALRKIDTVLSTEAELLLILPITDASGLEAVLNKISEHLKKIDLEIKVTEQLSISPNDSQSVLSLFKILL